MHSFSHAPTMWVCLMFLKPIIWHFFKIKQIFTTLKIYHWPSMPQQMENHDKLQELSLTFYKISICNLLSHKSSPMKRNILLLIFDMLVGVVNLVVTNSHPRMWCCYLPLTCMFLQSIKFRNQKFLFLFQLHCKSYISHGSSSPHDQ
jgi:hypothetical protein